MIFLQSIHFFRFLGLDMRQVHRTVDLSRVMIKHAFAILEGHFLFDDDSYRKLMVVEDRLRTLENNIRATEAHDESDLLLTLMGALKQTKVPRERLKQSSQEKPSDETQVIDDLKHASQEAKQSFLRNISLSDGGGGDGGDGGDSSPHVSSDSAKPVYVTEGEANDIAVEKPPKRKETGAIPKLNRTTKNQRKV